MAKDLVKEGIAFALGVVKISGEQFNKVIKQLERKNKVSSKEGKKMVYSWLADQQRQLEKMKRQLKKESLRTRLYNTKDLATINRVLKRITGEIDRLQKKKAKATTRKRKKPSRKKKAVKKKAKRKAKKKKGKR